MREAGIVVGVRIVGIAFQGLTPLCLASGHCPFFFKVIARSTRPGRSTKCFFAVTHVAASGRQLHDRRNKSFVLREIVG